MYLRLSLSDMDMGENGKNESNSIDSQRLLIRNYLTAHPEITGDVTEYKDDGHSGLNFNRPAFRKMIDDAKAGKFDLIITKEISRFSRNTLDSIKYTRELLSYGVAVLFVNDNINTALPDAELRLTIMASMAQDEIRRLSERVKFGMQQAIKNGHILGNNIFYGYKKNKETGCLYIIESQAEVIRKLFIL